MAFLFTPSEMSNGTFTFVSTCASLAGTFSNIASTWISTFALLARTLSNIVPQLISTCASLAGTLVLLRSIVGEVIADQLKYYFHSFFDYLFTLPSSNLTLVINESNGIADNEVYNAANLYLPTKIGPKTKRLGLSKTDRQENFEISIEKDEEIEDIFDGIQLIWRYKCEPREKYSAEKKFFELSFDQQFKDKVVNFYLPHVLARAEQIKEASKVVKIYNRNNGWDSMILEHPATFDTIAMDPELKKMIIHDLERFQGGRKFYKKVGRPWKRGYLLYGPPGTGKSSFIAAMANYLKFDIYDLELASIYSNSELRDVLISTTNRSIVVIEDIDCSVQFQDTENQHESDKPRLTLSGVLNFIDGLWSSCGDERIIVFTTNHKDSLDPALLRPGRMDVHISLSYCTVDVFRILASNYLSNYLDINDGGHRLFGEIESLMKCTEVTPAEVAGELMREEDADLALQGLVNFLKHKRSKCNKIDEEDAGIEEGNSLKSDNEKGGQGNTKTVRKGRDKGLID